MVYDINSPKKWLQYLLVVVVQPLLKNLLVKMGSSSPRFGVNIKKILKPPPRGSIRIPIYTLNNQVFLFHCSWSSGTCCVFLQDEHFLKTWGMLNHVPLKHDLQQKIRLEFGVT